ncbi:hypothetical protein BC829DRAFT_441077 [Chytridium lagenaria]|nr:hypothetical protein BC829DRAFT_441077 [Chytridium lagenaria]
MQFKSIAILLVAAIALVVPVTAAPSAKGLISTPRLNSYTTSLFMVLGRDGPGL